MQNEDNRWPSNILRPLNIFVRIVIGLAQNLKNSLKNSLKIGIP